MGLFVFAVMAAIALFRPQQEEAQEWMRGRVAEVIDCRTFGFQPEGKDFWYTARDEGADCGQDLVVGQAVEVCPVAFERDGVMRAKMRR
jgi:hypothetical protein